MIQPNHFVSSGSTGLYYAVFQTNGWTGNLTATFSLSEAGTVVQTMIASGTVSEDQAYAAIVLSVAATMPQSAFVGPAMLTASTIAVPSDGGPTLNLTTYATLEFGGTGTRKLVQAIVGISSSNGESGFPCDTPHCAIQIPPGSVAIQPAAFLGVPDGGTIYYAVVQANGWGGEIQSTAEVTLKGHLLYTIGLGGIVAGRQEDYSVVLFGSGGYVRFGYSGPAVLTVTSVATSSSTRGQFTTTSYAPLQLQ